MTAKESDASTSKSAVVKQRLKNEDPKAQTLSFTSTSKDPSTKLVDGGEGKGAGLDAEDAGVHEIIEVSNSSELLNLKAAVTTPIKSTS